MYTITKNDRVESILLSGFDRYIVEMLKDCNAFLAGGSIVSIISNTKINDYDIFFRKEEDMENCYSYIRNQDYFKYNTENTLTLNPNPSNPYKTTIQLITKMYDEPVKILESFDLTICKAGYLFKEREFLTHKDFLLSNFEVSSFINPVSTLFRVNKYMERGFTPSKKSVSALIMVCAMKGFDNDWFLREYLMNNKLYPNIMDYYNIDRDLYKAYTKVLGKMQEYIKNDN